MSRATVIAAALACAALFLGREAAADITKGQCVEANTQGQNLRRDGKLGAARAQFQVCNDAKCPEIVRTDCTTRLDEVEAAYPAIGFDVTGTNGADLAAVKISVDGVVVAEKLDGKPLRVDPGSHVFKFEAAGEKDVVKTFVLNEGEKSRHEKIAFGPEAPPAAALTTKPATTPQQPSTGPNGDLLRLGGIVLGAGGVLALGAGVFYGLKASSKASDQKDDCASVSNCKNHPQALSDHDGAVVWGRFSTIGFVVGAVLLAGGAVLYFTAPKSDTTGPAASARLTDPLRFTF